MSVNRDLTLEWIKACAAVLAENKEYLTQLDAAIGDADHGANMDRGFRKVIEKMPEYADKDIGTIFKTTGMSLISTVGGAAGPLYGTFFPAARHEVRRDDGAEPGRLVHGIGRRPARCDYARQGRDRR